jgi:CofD-related protein of GAK system
MPKLRVYRQVSIPDELRISRYRKTPELGPRLLFFSGGSALTEFSKVLKNYTHNSIHLVTPFDSGGSSAKLRDAFKMPAIGDLRSRLMALADETVLGHPEIYELFSYRLPENKSQQLLKQRLKNIVNGNDPLVDEIANPMRKLICNYLGYFVQSMPDNFDLQGASIGNLIITGGYHNNHEELDPIIFLFSKLANVLGIVRTTTNDDYHLSATLADNSTITGQHLLTGKEVAPLHSAITKLYLTKDLTASDPQPITAKLKKQNRKLIEQADLICYPPGSFYSSLIANLLPSGVGKAIESNDCPKIYIPNMGDDPEQLGMSLGESITTLLSYLRQDLGEYTPTNKLLNLLLVDSKNIHYPGGIPYNLLTKLGIEIIDIKLLDKKNTKYYDNKRMVATLLSLT